MSADLGKNLGWAIMISQASGNKSRSCSTVTSVASGLTISRFWAMADGAAAESVFQVCISFSASREKHEIPLHFYLHHDGTSTQG